MLDASSQTPSSPPEQRQSFSRRRRPYSHRGGRPSPSPLSPWLYLIFWLVACAAVFYFFRPLSGAFAAAFLWAYLGHPWVSRLGPYTGRFFAALSWVLGSGVLMLFLFWKSVPVAVLQFQVLLSWIPRIVPLSQAFLARFHITLPWPDFSPAFLKNFILSHWQGASDAFVWLWYGLSSSGNLIISWMLHLVLVPLMALYLLKDWPTLGPKIASFMPPRWRQQYAPLLWSCHAVLGAFFRGQLLVILALMLYYSAALGLVGLRLALLVGLLTGLVSFIPFVGTIFSLVLALLAVVLQGGDASLLLKVSTVYALGHVLEGMILSPFLIGGRIGLHPLSVIVSVILLGAHLGLWGVLCALPLAAVLRVILADLFVRYTHSQWYQRG